MQLVAGASLLPDPDLAVLPGPETGATTVTTSQALPLLRELAAQGRLHWDPAGARQIVATYDYVDEEGALLFQAVRVDPKGFAQRRPDGRGGWIWKTANTRRVL